jgi:hypothetical protein
VLLGSAHYHLVPVVVASGIGDAAAAAGTDAVVVAVAAAAVAGGMADAAVAGSHRAGSGGIAVVRAEDEEAPVPVACVDNPADVELVRENVVVAANTDLEAAVDA